MEKRICSRAIITEADSIVVLFRRKVKADGYISEYYSLPGGGLEPNETLEENIIREIKEEYSIDIQVLEYLGKEEDDTSITHLFHCKRVGGTYKLGGPEAERNSDNNYYEIKYLKISEIDKSNISYKNVIKKALKY
jgi:8-oxo-dGTP pyrophosphatase MutT (NUDIX family)